ncbi:hypothetical protein PTUN_a3404 [Pseudoalteromonas tunicata]|nr:hypothetical protein PTUN_a3404 [Pseudoalteromonas tunicata]
MQQIPFFITLAIKIAAILAEMHGVSRLYSINSHKKRCLSTFFHPP